MNDFENLSLATTYEIDDSFDSEKFIKMRLRVCHDGKNPNGSFFSVDTLESARESLKNAWVLAHVIYDDDEEDLDFGSHDMHIEDHQMKGHEGERKVVYDEQIIGIIPESNNYAVAEFDGRKYVYCDAFVSVPYGNYASDIIQRDKTVNLSMEIDVDAGHYCKQDKTYHIDAFRYRGVTLLGKKVGTGMLKAAGTIESFSKENALSMLDELREELEKYQTVKVDNNPDKEGGLSALNKDRINEILGEYGFAIEELTFEITEEMTEEEFRANLDTVKEEREAFALQGQIVEELNEQLSTEMVECEWGSYSRYWFVDYDPEVSMVYCYDVEDWKLYGFAYSLEGDAITIDFESKARKKFVIADFVDGSAEHFSFAQIVNDITTSMNETRAQLQAEYDSYVESHATANEEVEALRSFQTERLETEHKAAVDAVLAEFADLAENEEFASLTANAYSYENIEDLTRDCYVIRGKAVKPTFAAKPAKPAAIKIPVEPKADEIEEPYGGLFSIFSQK